MADSAEKNKAIFKIVQLDSSYFVWNADDAYNLRQYRIVGALAGTMHCIREQDRQTLPLKLMVEEVLFLRMKGMAEIVQFKKEKILPKEDLHEKAYERWLKLDLDRQSLYVHQRSLEMRLKNSRRIVIRRKEKRKASQSNSPAIDTDDGEQQKKRRLSEHEVTSDEIAAIEEEIRSQPIRRLKETEMSKEIWLECPFLPLEEYIEPVSTELVPRTDRERLRFAVFVDLWEKGYFLSTGLKFGADFLAYPGDPCIYHGSYMVICQPDAVNLESIDIAGWCRLGTQVKKTVLFCSWDSNDSSKVVYKSVKWKRFVDVDPKRNGQESTRNGTKLMD